MTEGEAFSSDGKEINSNECSPGAPSSRPPVLTQLFGVRNGLPAGITFAVKSKV